MVLKRVFSRRNAIIFISAAVIVYLAMMLLSDWEALISITISPIPILLFLLLVTADYMLRAIKWHLYSTVLGAKISFRRNLVVFLSGLSMTITPVRLGEVLKCYLLKRFSGFSVSGSLPAVVVERLTDIIALCILSLSGIFISRSSAMLAAVFSLMIIVLLFAIKNRPVYRVLSKLPLLNRFVSQIENLYKSSRSLTTKRVVLLSVMITLPAWFFESLGMWLIISSLGINASILTVVFIFSFSSVFGALSMLPGGIGVAEASITVLLMQLLFLDITTAIWITIITRLCTLWFGTALGVIFLSISDRMKIENSKG